MGNTSQCRQLSNIDQQYHYLGQENHFLFGHIKHFKQQKLQNQHFAIKKLTFPTQTQLKKFRQFILFYQTFSSTIRLIRANQYVDPSTKLKSYTSEATKTDLSQNLNSKPVFYCNKDNFIFISQSEELFCTQPAFYINIYIQYLQHSSSLQSILNYKIQSLQKATQNSKINQNILLQLQSKVKLCEYGKIDNLPQKERSIMNLFFNQIQVLRMLDCMLTALYGLKLYGIEVDAVRPDLFFKPLPENDQLSYFHPQIINNKEMDNFRKSYQTLKRWLTQENAKFHHNWNVKQKQLICYLHPDNLQKLTQMIVAQGQENFVSMDKKHTLKYLEKQNIFALGLIMLEICLLEPHICSKIYNVSICKKEEKLVPSTKKEIKYSFQKQNLTIKFNNSALQKYLIRIKTRYSQGFQELIETMIFGCSFNETSKLGKSVTKDNQITYQKIIEKLEKLIEQNVEDLKSVYNSNNKSKSKSKHTTEKNSRNSSLSRQVSASGVSNNQLSSSPSLSMLPVQTQQKFLSIELLKKQYKKTDNKLNQLLVKSELQILRGSFIKREEKLEELISKEEQRILTQLNKLNNQNPLPQKQSRFSYRKAQNMQPTNHKFLLEDSIPKSINSTLTNEEWLKYKLNVTNSLTVKNKAQSQEKQKRLNSTTKTKKIYLQKARQQQSLGSSVCHTINLNKSNDMFKIDSSKPSIYNKTVDKSKNEKQSTIDMKNTQITDKQISTFDQDAIQSFKSKSELKNLISLKKKGSSNGGQIQYLCSQTNISEKEMKQLKSKELYEIYMKEYRNLVNSQRQVNQ